MSASDGDGADEANDRGDVGENNVDRIAGAYDAAVGSLTRVVQTLRAVEAELAEEEARRVEGSRAALRPLRSARMAVVEARKTLTLAMERADARRRAFEREWFEPE